MWQIIWPVCCKSLWTLGDRAKEVPWPVGWVAGARQIERLLNIQSPDPGTPGGSHLSSEQSTTEPLKEKTLSCKYHVLSWAHLDLEWGQDCYSGCSAAHSPWAGCFAAPWPWQTWPCGGCSWSTWPGEWGRSGRSSGPGQRWWPERSRLLESPW